MIDKPSTEQQKLIEQLKEENEFLHSALDKTQCGRELVKQQKEFSLLLEVSKTIVSELDIKQVFKLVASKARRIIDADLLLVPMIDDNRQYYTYAAASGEGADEILSKKFKIHVGMCGWVLQNEKSLLFGESNSCWIEEKPAWEEGQQSALLVPLFGRKKIIGGLSALGKKGGGSFTRRDLDLLTMYANQVSIAIENASLFQDWQETITELTQEIDERKQAEESLQILFESTVHQVGQKFFDNLTSKLCQYLGCECAIIGSIIDSKIIKAIAMEIDGKKIFDFSYELTGSPCANAVQQGFCHYKDNLIGLFPDDVDLVKLRAEGYVGIPIKNLLGEPIGVICALSRKKFALAKGSEKVMNILAARTAAEIERLRVENALQKSLGSLNDAQRMANLGHHERDLITSEVFWSDGFYRLFGFEPGEIQSSTENFWSFVHWDDLDYMKKKYEAALAEAKTFDCEFRALKKNGEIRIMHGLGEFVGDAGKSPTYYRGTVQDITEKKQIEEELAKTIKLKSVGLLAGGIAHDFNNMLSAILGNVDLALHYTKPGDKTHKLLIEAEKAAMRAKDLTQQLLTFSKGGEPIKKLTAINDVITDSANFVLRGSKVRCSFSLAQDLWNVEIDAGQISQVIQNLVINAGHAMPSGGVVKISTVNYHQDDEPKFSIKDSPHIKIIIQDTGVGIPQNLLNKIFDPYFTTKQEGSGLGLAITHSIIRKHQGLISVVSEQGQGTSFTILLPAVDSEKIVEPTSSNEIRQGCGGTIMIMDDEEMVRDVVRRMLIHLGYDVILTKDGKEAIDLYKESLGKEKKPDLIIMDLTIPGGMGGKEAVQKILNIDPKAKIIVCSGYADDPIMANCKDYGFCAAIVKPIQLQELSQVMSHFIN